ncbi:heme ABC transporter ATP-binding protein [Corynebacterium choanae]|uniref:Hemin import ATP-binding protein HmuV n=1 Tax=Corynebacterium choanae TaxID=1862358 RepID=A0A3G6J3S2_9CORY|nr:heme ABC transporter ATP-binding protein [Corynebacterium choanae]AZA12576.1 Hemin import ATP-binding protein HmuV [Corynebacterium choanae]
MAARNWVRKRRPVGAMESGAVAPQQGQACSQTPAAVAGSPSLAAAGVESDAGVSSLDAPAVLEVSDLAVAVGPAKRRRIIVQDVSFHLSPGEVVGLIGPNGAGKSTLLAALSGDIAPAAGAIRYGGRPLAGLSDRLAAQHRAVMLQDTSVAFSYTVEDVVRMGRSAWPNEPAGDDSIVHEALRQVELLDYRDRDIATLSGGERARCAFARVIAQDTRLLLLDEPTAAMDIGHSEKTMALVRSLAAQGKAVLIVMHDLAAAARHCDRLILLAEHTVKAIGSPQTVCTAEHLSAAYQWPVAVHEHAGDIVIRPQQAPAPPVGG